MTYECHITINAKDASIGTVIANARKWKTSEIARDPLLGDATFFYLTVHRSSLPAIYKEMKTTVYLLKESGIEVLREKIELIVYDTKTGIGTEIEKS